MVLAKNCRRRPDRQLVSSSVNSHAAVAATVAEETAAARAETQESWAEHLLQSATEMGHSDGDLVSRQPEAMLHLLETFYLSGEVDESLFEYVPMDFTPNKTFQQMAREFVAQADASDAPSD